MIGNSPLALEFWEKGRSDACPVYDMHGHMGVWHSIYFPRAEAARMVHTMDGAGVRMLCFCHHASLFSPEIGNSANVAAVRQFPDRLRAYMAVNPNYPELLRRDLDTFDDYRDVYVGFKFLADYHKVPLDAEAYRPAWEFANERKLLILTHTWGRSPLDGPEVVRKMAERYPDVRLLLGHSCHGEWDKAISVARDCPNAYLELTAVLDDRGVVERFVGAGLAHKMLFGTDLPWFDPQHDIGCLLSADITDEDRHLILHRNAEELLAGVGVL